MRKGRSHHALDQTVTIFIWFIVEILHLTVCRRLFVKKTHIYSLCYFMQYFHYQSNKNRDNLVERMARSLRSVQHMIAAFRALKQNLLFLRLFIGQRIEK